MAQTPKTKTASPPKGTPRCTSSPRHRAFAEMTTMLSSVKAPSRQKIAVQPKKLLSRCRVPWAPMMMDLVKASSAQHKGSLASMSPTSTRPRRSPIVSPTRSAVKMCATTSPLVYFRSALLAYAANHLPKITRVRVRSLHRHKVLPNKTPLSPRLWPSAS